MSAHITIATKQGTSELRVGDEVVFYRAGNHLHERWAGSIRDIDDFLTPEEAIEAIRSWVSGSLGDIAGVRAILARVEP